MEETESKFCPECGYDLRATDDNRCPECGSTFDRETLLNSRLPWSNWRRYGWLQAYLRTVWAISIDSISIRSETNRTQSLKAARAFGRITFVLVVLAFLPQMWEWAKKLEFDTQWNLQPASLHPDLSALFGGAPPPEPWRDWTLPWAIVIAPLMWVSMLMVAMTMAFGFRIEKKNDPASMSLSIYAMAPLALLIIPSMIFEAMRWGIDGFDSFDDFSARAEPLHALIVLLTLAVPLLLAIWRGGLWYARVRGGGVGTCLRGVLFVPFVWIVGIGMWGFVFPWCVGELAMIIRNLG